MKRGRVAVALCTYNGALYLQEQLNSILEQERLPDEVVICDDNSTDGTPGILRSFAAAAPFPVRIYSNSQRLGSTQNFGRAVENCVGDFIALADQDDVWHPAKLRLSEEVLSDSPAVGAVFSDAEVVDENLQARGYTLLRTQCCEALLQESFASGGELDLLSAKQIVTGATLCFRASYRELILPFPAGVVHDAWIALMIGAVARIALIPRPLMLYRQHAANQIGAGPRGVLRRLGARESWKRSPAFLHHDLNRCSHAGERLRARACVLRDPDILQHLQGRADHLRMRVSLPQRRIRRLPAVWRALATRQYTLYGSGTISAIKDLLL